MELFFNNQIYVGKALSVNRLQSFLLQYLYDERYDIYEVEVDIEGNNEINIDSVTGQIKVEEFQRLYPNIIYTQINYD